LRRRNIQQRCWDVSISHWRQAEVLLMPFKFDRSIGDLLPGERDKKMASALFGGDGWTESEHEKHEQENKIDKIYTPSPLRHYNKQFRIHFTCLWSKQGEG
jgi:hypothetical protein